MSLDSVSRFTGTVDNYVKYRPKYPKELFDFLRQELGLVETICELGAGTGIFTRQLEEARIGKNIIALEPNDSMRAAAEREQRGKQSIVAYVKGTAECSGRPSREADCVLGAQCFHWFDLGKALPEIARITKPDALCCAIWNDRVEVGFNSDLEKVLQQSSGPYRELKRPDQTIRDLQRLLPHGKEVQFDYHQDVDQEGLLGRMASTSYVMHGVDDKPAFNARLEDIYKKHEKNGKVRIIYKTRVFVWRNVSSRL
jgi:ubiquinone/menaquinone biosynthesis C-methylase UbiE